MAGSRAPDQGHSLLHMPSNLLMLTENNRHRENHQRMANNRPMHIQSNLLMHMANRKLTSARNQAYSPLEEKF